MNIGDIKAKIRGAQGKYQKIDNGQLVEALLGLCSEVEKLQKALKDANKKPPK